VLDEPTNGLDLETLDVLEEMIGDYAGTVLLISHDRDFLDRVVDDVIALDANGKWLEYAGGYTDMLAKRGDDLRKLDAKPVVKATASDKSKLPRAVAEPVKRKLNFNEKHALETLPGKIATLETEIARLQKLMADTTLYARDRATFDQVSFAMTAMQSELAAAEQRWLELELLRGEIEGA